MDVRIVMSEAELVIMLSCMTEAQTTNYSIVQRKLYNRIARKLRVLSPDAYQRGVSKGDFKPPA